MRRTNKAILLALCLAAPILLAGLCRAEDVFPSLVASQADSAKTGAAAPAQSASSAAASNQTQQSQSNASATQNQNAGEDLYTFKTEVQEVVLHATVVDEHGRRITGLDRDAFHILDNGKPQRVHSFRQEDIPVAMAIVIDNSGSMRDKRPGVNAAALNLVRASNPQDQVCVINFNNEPYLDQDYTGEIGLLKAALEHIESRGGTALYDTLEATSDHLMKTAKLQKKVILVVTDGEDTASHDSLDQAVRAIAVDGGPAIYSIGILGHEKEKKARSALRTLSEQTGGEAFFPTDLTQVEAISQEIAHAIRNQYTIGYKPSMPMVPGSFHTVAIKAQAKGYKGLTVRTRTGYYVPGGGQPKASK